MNHPRKKKFSFLFGSLGAILVLFLGLALAPGADADTPLPKHERPGRPVKDPTTLLVKFRAPAADASTAGALGDTLLAQVGAGIAVVKLKPGKAVEQALVEYSALANVEYAEPNYLASVSLDAPNDPRHREQWGLAKVQAVDGWSRYPGSYTSTVGVPVAVLDTGVQANHPDLSGRIDPGQSANCVNDTSTCVAGATPDEHGHGTHVAGIIGAATWNATGVSGIAFNSPIMAVKVADQNGMATYAAIISGIQWALQHGAKVVNISIGGYGYSQALCDAVGLAERSHQALIVAAAGNDGSSDRIYPASCPEALGVAATDQNDASAPFSNYGLPNVFMSAPGVNILSTYLDGAYAEWSGTSMAAPFVSGAAALLYSQQTRTKDEITEVLARTADKVGTAAYGIDAYGLCGCSWNATYGYGRLNLSRALAGPPPTPTWTPTATATRTPSPTATGTSTPVATPAPGTSYTVYDDTLRWTNWSWKSTVNFSATSPVHAGSRSISVTHTGAWAGFLLHTSGLSTSAYTNLQFAIRPNSRGLSAVDLALYDTANKPIRAVSLQSFATQGANGWYQVNVPLSSLGAVNTTITGILLQDNTGASQAAYYLDQVQFTAAASPTPTPTPAPPAVPTPTTTMTPTPRAPTPTPTISPHPTATPVVASPAIVFDDHIRWTNRSWETQTYKYWSQAPPGTPSNAWLEINHWAAWGAFSLESTGFSTVSYSHLLFEFWPGRNGPIPLSSIAVSLYDSQGRALPAVNPTSYAGDIRGNRYRVLVPLTALGGANTTITRVQFQDNTGSPLWYGLDNIRFVAQDGTSPTPTPAIPSPAPPSATPSPSPTSPASPTAVPSPTATSTPIGVTLLGRLEAEAYRNGGEGVGYHDTSAGNAGGTYRTDNVDIEATTDVGGGYNVGWVASGEWLAYDVNVPHTGLYTVTARVASAATGTRSLHVEVDGTNVTGPLSFASTGGWQRWTNVSKVVMLPAGPHVLKVVMDTSSLNLNFVEIQPAPGAPLPGRVQAEDYNPGGEGVGYHDTTAGNTGGVYRADGVDIEASADMGDGYNVGWTATGEWLEYDVSVSQTGTYEIIARVASRSSAIQLSLHVEIDGVNVSGPMTFAPTGGWQTWTDVKASVTLPPGTHRMRVVMDTAGINLSYIEARDLGS